MCWLWFHPQWCVLYSSYATVCEWVGDLGFFGAVSGVGMLLVSFTLRYAVIMGGLLCMASALIFLYPCGGLSMGSCFVWRYPTIYLLPVFWHPQCMKMGLLGQGWRWHLSYIVPHWLLILYWIFPEFCCVQGGIKLCLWRGFSGFIYVDCMTSMLLHLRSHIPPF